MCDSVRTIRIYIWDTIKHVYMQMHVVTYSHEISAITTNLNYVILEPKVN